MPETRNWLQRTLSRETTPGISVRDGLTRFGTFFHKPGDSRWRNAGRIARAVGIGLVAGPGGVFGAATRSAAQGEAREGLGHVARQAWGRYGPGRGGAPEPSQGDSRLSVRLPGSPAPSDAPPGYLWPTDMGPPEQEEIEYTGHGAPPPGGGQRPSLNTFALMREAPGAAAWAQGLAMQHKPRNVEK